MLKKAPIAFFAFNRPEHTRRSLQSLLENNGSQTSHLYIFCDGAKCESDKEDVNEVRRIARSQQWCGNVHIIESEENKGLANSIIAGVTRLCDEYGRVIVLEDDLILSPFFLNYMNDALDVYQEESRVMQVSGYMFPLSSNPSAETCFLPFISSWGWATWSRAWQYFDPSMKGYEKLASNPGSIEKFDLDGCFPYFSMLREQHEGSLDSWAIRWYLSVFMANGLALYPGCTLVKNTGFDGSGTHCSKHEKLEGDFCKNPVNVSPVEMIIDAGVYSHVKEHLSRQGKIRAPYKRSMLTRFKNILSGS